MSSKKSSERARSIRKKLSNRSDTNSQSYTRRQKGDGSSDGSRDKLPVLGHFRFRFGSRDRHHLEQRIFNDYRNK